MDRRNFLRSVGLGVATIGLSATSLASNHQLKVEVYNKGVWSWTRAPFSSLKAGMIFRCIEPNGVVADSGTEYEICLAATDCYKVDGVDRVQCEPLTRVPNTSPLIGRLVLWTDGQPMRPVRWVTRTDSQKHMGERVANKHHTTYDLKNHTFCMGDQTVHFDYFQVLTPEEASQNPIRLGFEIPTPLS